MSNRRNPFIPSTYFQASSNNGGDVDRERVYDSKIMGWEDESSGRVSPVHRFSIVLGARVAPLARCVTLAPGRSAAGPSEWLTVAKNTVAEADPPIAQPSRTRPRCASETVRESDLFVRTMRLWPIFLFRFAPRLAGRTLSTSLGKPLASGLTPAAILHPSRIDWNLWLIAEVRKFRSSNFYFAWLNGSNIRWSNTFEWNVKFFIQITSKYSRLSLFKVERENKSEIARDCIIWIEEKW